MHRRRRAALNPFFSKRSVVRLEARISEKVKKLCDRLAEESQRDRVVDAHTAYTALTTDIITDYCYGYSYTYLAQDDFNKEWKDTMREIFERTALRRHCPWLIQTFMALPLSVATKLSPMLAMFMKAKDEIRKELDRVFTVHSGTKSNEKESIFTELRDTNVLPKEEKTLDRLTDEAFVLVGAGTETTAKVLAETTFHILNTPRVLQKLTAELAKLDNEMASRSEVPTWNRLEKLPYLVSYRQSSPTPSLLISE